MVWGGVGGSFRTSGRFRHWCRGKKNRPPLARDRPPWWHTSTLRGGGLRPYVATNFLGWGCAGSEPVTLDHPRVRSMRMGFVIRGGKCEIHLCHTLPYRGRARTYRGGGARDSCLLPWKPVRKFEDSCVQFFAGVPVTYKFSSFHWSPHNLQVFTGLPKFSDRISRK